MQYLFFIGHIFYASDITPTYFYFSSSHFVDFIYNLYLSTTSTEFIAGQCNILHSSIKKDIFPFF